MIVLIVAQIFAIPLLFLLVIGIVFRQMGWTYQRVFIALALAVSIPVLLVSGLVTWAHHSTPHPPPLTEKESLAIIQRTPEFQDQGHSPTITSLVSPRDSLDLVASGQLAFTKNDGDRVENAAVCFTYSSGHWRFESMTWRTAPSTMTYVQRGLPTRIDTINTPEPIGTRWVRQKDGTYAVEPPGTGLSISSH